VPINGKPFIDILLDHCIDQGLRRFIICVGYLKEQVIKHLKDRNDCEIVFSEEDEPLGTGGALKNAEPILKSDLVLVMNGDTINYLDFYDFIHFHELKNSLLSIILSKKIIQGDYGSINIDINSRITCFNEKNKTNKYGFVNAGIYLFQKNIIRCIKSNLSLEKDFFPLIINKINCYGYKTNKSFIDIGTPESYSKATKVIDV